MKLSLLKLAEEHRYEDLFLDHLYWDEGDYNQPLRISVDVETGNTETFTLENVAAYKGIRVFVCDSLPSRTDQAKIATHVGQKSTHYFLIFHDGGAHQTWRWPAQVLRGEKASIKLTSHEHTRGLQNPKLAKRLESIILIPGDNLSVTEMYDRIQAAFDTETADETKKASKLMVDLFEALKEAEMSEEHISETLARILFVMFGDDTEMWGAGSGNLFERYIQEHTSEDGSDIAVKLNELFAHLDTKPKNDHDLVAEGKPELKGFRYVNGGIFSDPKPLPAGVGAKFREAILRASRTDWADISPAIFGSMFQSVRDAKTRRSMGEHYTSEKDILKTLNPLFLDELREVFHNARDKSDESKRLRDLRQRISRIKFMDPACGCGNFVIIAYRELRALETAIVARLIELGTIKESKAGFLLDVATQRSDKERVMSYEPMVVIDNFYGIEIDPWPAAIARTAMFLIERQSDQLMNEKFAYTPARLPIRQESHIVTADAAEIDWKEVLPIECDDEIIIAGNPPFIGYNDRSPLQLKQIISVLGNKSPGRLDFVALWYLKSIDYFSEHAFGKFAFVSTSSITQGEPVGILFERILNGDWKISFAYQPFRWKIGELKGDQEASVHCVIIGMEKNFKGEPSLYKKSGDEFKKIVAKNINAYLVDADSIIVKKRNGKPISSMVPPLKNGSVAGDTTKNKESQYKDAPGLVMSFEEGEGLKSNYPELEPYLRLYAGGQDVTKGKVRYCLWFESEPPESIRNHSEISKRLTNVSHIRLASTEPSTQALGLTPWRFKYISQPTTRYICIPRTGSGKRKYMLATYLDETVIVSNGSFWGEDADGFAFALINSSMMLAWQNAVGGRLNDDPRFANTLVWNTFPVPPVSSYEKEKIVQAGKNILSARQKANDLAGHIVNLENLYNSDSMPLDLVLAHEKLDKLVDQAFGAEEPLVSDGDRLQLLFNHYSKMVAEENNLKVISLTKKHKTRAKNKE